MKELMQQPSATLKLRSSLGQTLLLTVGALFIVGLMAVFGWKMFDDSQVLVSADFLLFCRDFCLGKRQLVWVTI